MLNNRTIAGPGALLANGLLALLNPADERCTLTENDVKPAVPRLFALLCIWNERARSRHDLARIDQRIMDDIGLTENDVRIEAAKPFWKA